MIRDGDRRMSPLIGPLHNILGLRHAVHIAHLRMTVQLHTLAHTGIHAGRSEIRYLLDPCQGTDGQFMVELIHQRHPLDLHKSPRFHITSQLRHLIVVHKHLDRHRVGKVRHIEDQNGPFILDLPLVHIQDLPADDHLAHLADDIADGHGLFLKVPSIQHIRVIGTLKRPSEIVLLSLFAFSCSSEG